MSVLAALCCCLSLAVVVVVVVVVFVCLLLLLLLMLMLLFGLFRCNHTYIHAYVTGNSSPPLIMCRVAVGRQCGGLSGAGASPLEKDRLPGPEAGELPGGQRGLPEAGRLRLCQGE